MLDRFGERHGRAADRLRERGDDHFLAAVHRLLGARREERLARKTRGIDFRVGRDHDGIGCGDVFGCELILRADRTLGLDLDRVPERLGCFLQSFGRHESVGDSGRAGGDPDKPLSA